MKPWKIGASYAVAFSCDGRLRRPLVGLCPFGIWHSDRRCCAFIPSCIPPTPPSLSSTAWPSRAHRGGSSSDAQSGQIAVDFKNAADGEGSNHQYSSCGSYIVDGIWGGRLAVRRASTGATILSSIEKPMTVRIAAIEVRLNSKPVRGEG